MEFAGKVWRLLVGIKDGLVLMFLLLFFAMLFAVLSARPSPAQVHEGALLLDLDGVIVEEPSVIDPFEALLAQEAPIREYSARDLVRALDAAATDKRIKAVVFDLSRFLGGGQVHLQAIGEAIDRVRAADKPVLTYALGYGDDAMLLAAHASEVWLDPMGGAIVAGPGGTRLYYRGLIDRLKINARIYKVGTYKAAVEPYARSNMSDEARENIGAVYASLWEEWKANVLKSRPRLKLDTITSDPAGWVEQSRGDLAKAALAAGLVDKLGDRVAFGERVAGIVGDDKWDDRPGRFARTELDPYLVDTAPRRKGRPIGVITIAGEIVDGDEGPGIAGGDRIARLLDRALTKDLAALIVRVDSPGGSVLASEEIRRAILRHKAKKIPIAVSMANVAASGGYWVSTPADRIFAQPETVTGSIGVFAVVPTLENTLGEIGVKADGVRTTPLSGQPDFLAGFTPPVDRILQASVQNTYAQFLERVANARKMSTQAVDEIGQGRIWDGGTARQKGLIDQFGGIEEAAQWAAKQAKLEDGEWYLEDLGGQREAYDALIRQLLFAKPEDRGASLDLFGQMAWRQRLLGERLLADLERLIGARGVQAYCLECPRGVSAAPGARHREAQASASLLERVFSLLD